MNSLTLRDLLIKKISKITKEFEELSFQQNLWIEFTKNDEVFKNKIFSDPWFDSEKIESNDINIHHK